MTGLQAHRALAEDLREADLRLRAWADWARSGRMNIGWPRLSMTARMVEWNRVGIRPDGGLPPPTIIPDEIAAIDALVAKLPEPQRNVIVIHYTYDDPREVKIRRAKIKRDQYRRYLDYARWAIRLGLMVK
jgi:hypothetical protein